MIIGKKHFGFLGKMIDGSYLNAADGYAVSGILECLKFLDHSLIMKRWERG